MQRRWKLCYHIQRDFLSDLCAFESLPSQSPYSVVAERAVRPSVEPLGLEDVPVHLVQLAPAAGAASERVVSAQ